MNIILTSSTSVVTLMSMSSNNMHRFAACCCLVLSSALVTNALVQTLPREFTSRKSCHEAHQHQPHETYSHTALHVLFDPTGQKIEPIDANGSADLFRTLELKDEALMQAQTAVSSLETALESAVSNLEQMQQQLQLQVAQMEQELDATNLQLASTQSELDDTKAELQQTQAELLQSHQLLATSQETAQKAEELEAYVNSLNEDGTKSSPAADKKKDHPWKMFTTSQKVIPVLNDWIAIKGTNEGEIQISGKVMNHPIIPDGDAIVTSPVTDPKRATEKKIVTTMSGSKYRLGQAMAMPSGESASQKITSTQKGKNRKSPQQLIKARSSITLPDLSGNTLGNG